MNKIEKIKFGNAEFDLVVGGVDLSDNGGKIAFQMGTLSLNEIKTIIKANGEISQIGLSGKTDWIRSDLIYAGRLNSIEEYVVATDEDGITEIKTDVAIGEFKLPDLNERIIALEKENAAMKESLGTLILNELEGK
ncbi:hypothetical protein SAMN05443270_2992 [Lacrimispora sphenoides]|uniref:hypothetical protein n=1 Tax=Lacrimispora sphenoides TaxID=29370 RepID=UPI0008CE5E3C|nr:hypothetical protein [Lacrimispora sphenoides]SEU07997.1 hypothetical protein SAMN05443270_2992 [Lacrimispora sphenoides]